MVKNTRRNKSKIDFSTYLAIIALVVLLLDLCNPHFEYEPYEKLRIIEVKGYRDLANDNVDKYIPGHYPDVKTMNIECTSGVKVTNDFDMLCNETMQFGCATRPLWELRGHGVCYIKYSGEARKLKWF